MNKIKKGDVVGRISYGKDIIFIVERIIKTTTRKEFAILKGVTIRIQADSDTEDLEKINLKELKAQINQLENYLMNRISKSEKEIQYKKFLREQKIIYTGKILHIDGDKKYSEKSSKYYKKVGLNAIVKNIPEYNQEKYIGMLIQKNNPDVLVITGHDGMIKKGTKYNELYNYRNSRIFYKYSKRSKKKIGQKRNGNICRSVPKLL